MTSVKDLLYHLSMHAGFTDERRHQAMKVIANEFGVTENDPPALQATLKRDTPEESEAQKELVRLRAEIDKLMAAQPQTPQDAPVVEDAKT